MNISQAPTAGEARRGSEVRDTATSIGAVSHPAESFLRAGNRPA